MSLDVSPALLEQAERGEVDEQEFVDCVRAGVLWKKEEGNVVSMREAHALDASMPKKHRHVLEDTSFTRSRDPCTGTACSARVSRKRHA
jgi:hypothetical protein